MQSNPDLDAKTKEIGLGVRRPQSVVSGFQRRTNELRNRLSGIKQYRDWLSSRSDFDDYESTLKTRNDGRSDVTDSDVATARDIVESNFASFSDFTGDQGSGTGVYAQDTYDAYRDYLTSNGVSSADADRHLQPIKDLFTPDDYFIDAVVNDLSSWDALQDWLFDRGWSIDEARSFVDSLKNEFASFSDFQSYLSGEISMDVVLNRYDHDVSESPGTAAVSKESGTLVFRANEIRHERLSDDEDGGVDPPTTLNWSMQTSAQTIDAGEETDVIATATSTRDDNWTTQVSLIVDGEVIQTQTVGVIGGNATAAFGFSRDRAAKYDVQVGDSSTITITVEP